MLDTSTLKLLSGYFSKFDFIDFVLLFGSQVTGNTHGLSDIDIGIHSVREIKLHELAIMENELFHILQKDIDILELNNLQYVQPKLAFEVVSNSIEIYIRDMECYHLFKTNTYLQYIDVKPMLDHFTEVTKKSIRERTL